MKKFEFTLQALQTLRERQEQLALQDYSQHLKASWQARQKAVASQKELEIGWGWRQKALLEGCGAGELHRLQTHSQMLEQKARACEYEAKVAENKTGLAFTRLLSARHARAVVEKVFDNQKRLYRRARGRYEQRSLDEIVNHRQALLEAATAGQTLS